MLDIYYTKICLTKISSIKKDVRKKYELKNLYSNFHILKMLNNMLVMCLLKY